MKDAPTVMTLSFKAHHAQYHRWPTEADCQTWLLTYLQDFNFIHTIREVEMKDVFGNDARVDLALLVNHPDGDEYLFVVEIKHHAHIGKNAADAYLQAHHYAEMCTFSDRRLPLHWQGRSPTMGFAGVFVIPWVQFGDTEQTVHEQRRAGMEILANKMRVGSVRCSTALSEVEFWCGENSILRLDSTRGVERWNSNAHNFVAAKVKRNGSRRDRTTVGEVVRDLRLQLDLF